ncbi:hypothetical protein JOQ06_020413, partial [Pogonophryne albipinna]
RALVSLGGTKLSSRRLFENLSLCQLSPGKPPPNSGCASPRLALSPLLPPTVVPVPLPLHLSANNLLEPAMPLEHLCLPPQIELFDTRRRHAATHRLHLQTYSMCTHSAVSMHPEGQVQVVSCAL